MKRWLAPEILQTSVMDCGPAALQCLLQGHGIPIAFERLREACQVQVDGTSIDQLEEVAQELGLDAEQVLVPADHVLRREQPCVPALAVVLTPSRMLHFVVIWGRVGRRVQIMDPARGRRFVTEEELRSELPALRVTVDAREWRAHASSFAFIAPLRARIAELTTRAHAQRMVDQALADPTYYGLAALDAATRAVAELARARAIKGAAQCAALIERWVKGELPIPESYWHALPTEDAPEGTPQVALGGALLVHIRGTNKNHTTPSRHAPPLAAAAENAGPTVVGPITARNSDVARATAAPPLAVVKSTGAATVPPFITRNNDGAHASAGLPLTAAAESSGASALTPAARASAAPPPTAAVKSTGAATVPPFITRNNDGAHASAAPPLAAAAESSGASALTPAAPPLIAAADSSRPSVLSRALALLCVHERRALWPLAAVAAATALAAQLEAILLRGELELGRYLSDPLQQSTAALSVLAFIALVSVLQLSAQFGALGLGRHLEARLRVAFSSKLARLDDRYLHSRPISDLADRSHMVHLIRGLPLFMMNLLTSVLELLCTGAALIWLDPGCAVRVAIACALSLGLPLFALSTLSERDARQRSHTASLAGYYFDALRGATALHAQRGAGAVLAEHEAGLTEWKRAGLDFARASVFLDAAVSLSGLALSIWLFSAYLQEQAEPLGALLFLFWATALPSHGRELAQLARQWPSFVNVLARLFEPLEAAENAPQLRAAPIKGGVALSFDQVSVQAGGHHLLADVQLQIAQGEHVAIVGASGAGKSSLLGVLLGWHRPTQGVVMCDGATLDAQQLRQHSVWLDPSVQLWDRSLHHNLTYATQDDLPELANALSSSELQSLLETLPDGLQTSVGEGGCRLSGGEGQRVRFARGWLQENPRLALLDEPFRGLDRAQRARLLAAARKCWANATMLCVTHDITETLGFARVLVVEAGRVVEDGAPGELAARSSSRYAALLRSERALLKELFGGPELRRVRLEDGRLHEIGASVPAATARDDLDVDERHVPLSSTLVGIGRLAR